MTYEELTKHRALNDYTADKVKQPPSDWKQPKKTAFCISSYSPGIELDLKNKQQPSCAKL